ncbi:MAG: adenylate/guanylate cyclase domain-containing protein [Campylobacterales bacterium]|nr:adenylate/guanylate cyclase domain-containing protein [Campylobacterales bacterium]
MEATHAYYDFNKTIERINSILNSSDNSYEDSEEVPNRTTLTYDNGYYTEVSILFVDIRGSTKLADSHTRPVLAKIFRSYISEVIAILRGNSNIQEVYIEGDGVWGVFSTPYMEDIDRLFSTAAQIMSLIDILNIHLKKRKYSEISVGIGLSRGNTLCIKAGHKGSGINEIVWLGKAVSKAVKLSNIGSRYIYASSVIYNNLNEHNKKLLPNYDYANECYYGLAVNSKMNEWVNSNK